jgi:hypothetical protein
MNNLGLLLKVFRTKNSFLGSSACILLEITPYAFIINTLKAKFMGYCLSHLCFAK